MGIIGWIIVGAIAGWLASMVMGKGGYGLIGDIIMGLIGAFIGGWLASYFLNIDINNGPWWESVIIAFIGAVIVIWVVRMLTRGRTTV
ncbi:MAG: GlsB/YeaQ/YmgE family stress response membrane protein [Chloroflexia bacterium]